MERSFGFGKGCSKKSTQPGTAGCQERGSLLGLYLHSDVVLSLSSKFCFLLLIMVKVGGKIRVKHIIETESPGVQLSSFLGYQVFPVRSPNSSPRAALAAGAVWTTTVLRGQQGP
ncbi:MAG: hypothetical protein MZV63_33300 [Marinilabiliales bacterium]|nr:hypothetical protein [Marinilabiliales bacterium]